MTRVLCSKRCGSDIMTTSSPQTADLILSSLANLVHDMSQNESFQIKRTGSEPQVAFTVRVTQGALISRLISGALTWYQIRKGAGYHSLIHRNPPMENSSSRHATDEHQAQSLELSEHNPSLSPDLFSHQNNHYRTQLQQDCKLEARNQLPQKTMEANTQKVQKRDRVALPYLAKIIQQNEKLKGDLNMTHWT